MLISPEYRELNQRLHEAMPQWGSGAGASWFARYLTGLNSVLDYGSGKGLLKVAVEDFRRYDPAIPEYAEPPSPADLVLCLTVMEHVETECVDAVLDHIRALSRQRVIFKISCHESEIRLADGSSVHRTVMHPDWWIEKLIDRWSVLFIERTNFGLRFVGQTKET